MADEIRVTSEIVSFDKLTPEEKLRAAILDGYGPTLAPLFDTIRETRTPSEAGGVPIPEAWECVRAVLGRVHRDTLERAYDGRHAVPGTAMHADQLHDRELVAKAAAKGTHLPAGLHIVTGQTGGGKSALVTNLALAAAKGGHPVMYVSLELDGEEVAARVLGLESGVPWYKLSLGDELTPEEAAKRDAAARTLTASGVTDRVRVHAPMGPLYIEDLRKLANLMWEDFGKVPLVVLDYLQLSTVLTDGSHRLPLREAIAAVVMALRHLSRRDRESGWPGCPVVVLSTTARSNSSGADAVEGLNGENPDALRRDNLEKLKSLPKEAGEIEATAVTAWVLALGERIENGKRHLALRLVKNRLGMAGAWVPFVFDGATGKLDEAPERYADARAKDHEAAQEREQKKQKNGKGSTGNLTWEATGSV